MKEKRFSQQKNGKSIVVYSVYRVLLYIVIKLVCGRWRILRETAVAKSHPVLVGACPAPA